jgi:hypothetical protein
MSSYVVEVKVSSLKLLRIKAKSEKAATKAAKAFEDTGPHTRGMMKFSKASEMVKAVTDASSNYKPKIERVYKKT